MLNARRLLVVDDDQDLLDTLAEQLALYDGFLILSVDTAASAINEAKADGIDLAIMDVGLPDMDGREAVKIMRRNGFRSPIIILTRQASDADTVLGLEAGANDYVVKPFKFPVLLARIRAQLRQHEASEDAVFQIGSFTFRAGAKLLVNEKGSKLKLTEKETAILRFLYRADSERSHSPCDHVGRRFERLLLLRHCLTASIAREPKWPPALSCQRRPLRRLGVGRLSALFTYRSTVAQTPLERGAFSRGTWSSRRRNQNSTRRVHDRAPRPSCAGFRTYGDEGAGCRADGRQRDGRANHRSCGAPRSRACGPGG
jgi:DNA-binding response OmpR family regulator